MAYQKELAMKVIMLQLHLEPEMKLFFAQVRSTFCHYILIQSGPQILPSNLVSMIT
jgi:hypothetical protein